jgi:moderate conductance mechanosensitive channel
MNLLPLIPQLPAADERHIVHMMDVLQSWREDAFEFLRRDAPKIIVIIIISAILVRMLRAITDRVAKFSRTETLPGTVRSQQVRTLSSVIHGGGIFLILFVAALMILQTLGINMGPLLASAGVVGLAVGFGAQTLVKDVITGFFVLMENQYDIGDAVKIAGVSGTVEKMTLRRTVLRDVDGTVHNVPNSQINVVSNLTRDWAQLTLHISVNYKEDSDKVVRLLKEIGTEVQNDPEFSDAIVATPEVPGIERVANGEVDYLMLVKTRPGKQYGVSRELRRRIKLCFEKNGIQPGGPARLYVVDNPTQPH